MSLSTYSDLQASVANWLNRTDLTDEIKDFISITESRLEREIKSPLNEKTVNLTVTSDSETVIPSDYIEAKDLFYKKEPLQRVSLGELYAYRDKSGTPTCFARKNDRFVLFPSITSVSTGDLELNYYFKLDRLSDSNTTNAMFTYSPELYLFGALKQAATFLGSDPSMYELRYAEAFTALMKHAMQAETSGSIAVVENGY
ncbi:MAG: hypothetical protein Unbinned4512contig1001_26 [Prokaryotic dsDNA virus sp.]|nr:MAG: hypothetical protein Unbinned4512contig1001_26 [Prokaryotic dsDNA virus sp.]|tara:strand:- start:3182 stop:3781 length:600 start_codon:yes stop_codon:yes gene_type:complete